LFYLCEIKNNSKQLKFDLRIADFAG